MQKVLKYNDVFSFHSPGGNLNVFVNSAYVGADVRNSLDWNDLTIDIPGYFTGSFFDLWLFQRLTYKQRYNLNILMDIAQIGKQLDINMFPAPLFSVSIPGGVEITLRYNLSRSSQIGSIDVFTSIVDNSVDSDFRLVKKERVPVDGSIFLKISSGYFRLGNSTTVHLKPYDLFRKFTHLYTCVLQNYDGFIDTRAMAFERMNQNSFYQLAANYTMVQACGYLFPGQIEVKNESYPNTSDTYLYDCYVFYQ